MKKLFSLILVALITSQMWAANYYAYVGISTNTNSAGHGTAWIDKVKTNTSGSATSCYQTSSTGKMYCHAIPNAGYIFEKWCTSANSSSTTSNYNPYEVYGKSSAASTYYAYFKPVTITVNKNIAAAGTASATALSPDKGAYNATTQYATGSTTLTATANGGYTFKNWTLNSTSGTVLSTNATYTYSGINANITIYANFEEDAPAEPEPEPTTLTAPGAVDLGLSVLWADRNLGAENTTDAGYYYAWGEIEPKDNYVSAGYSNPYTNFSDANDVARQKLGNNWRMPTYSELVELVNETSCSQNASGVTVTGNGASVYFPRAGHMDGTTKKGTDRVWLWTKSSYDNTQSRIIFAQSGSCLSSSSWYSCYCGLPVRAVYVGTTATATFKNGTTTIKTQKVIPGTAPTAPANPTKDADEDYTYAFTGWSTSQNGSVAAIGNINSNTTYYAQFSATPKPVAKYTVTITSPSEGTGTLTVTAGGNAVSSGTQLNKNTVITVNATPAEHYTGGAVVMQGETPVALTNNQFTLTGNVTISTNFTLRTYTIRFLMDDGTTVLSSAQVVYNGSPIEPSEPTKIGTEEYSYNFTGWTPAVTAVTGDQDYVAVFEQVAKAPKYDLTIGAFTNGSVTLTANGKTDVVPAAGGTYQYEEGTTIIVKAVPAKGYHFNQWNDANKAASRQVSEIAANMTLTPTFAENTPFLMDDTWEKATFISNCAAATGVLTVTLKDRTYSAGQWATLSVPFNCTLDQEDELYNAVYKLHTLTLAQDGGSVSFEFIRTNVVEANEPYLIVPRHDISTVIFHGVTLTTPAEVSRTTDDRVTFVSGLWKQTIAGPNEFYVATGNSLRYASTLGSVVKGNRAFFRKINDAASSPAPRRAIMVIDGEEVEVEIAGDAIEEVQDVRKYIENGVLIIERNGVRMDAQGKRID